MRVTPIVPFVAFASLVLSASVVTAQGVPAAASAVVAPPPPATKLEAFKPSAGAIVTFGYDDIFVSDMPYGVTVDAREIKATTGSTARGIVVDVKESQYRQERSFVDADEVDELLRGISTLMEIKENPTPFRNFEVRYQTRGELRITAFNTNATNIAYSLSVGRTIPARKSMSAKDMLALRTAIEQAKAKLASLPGK